MYQCGTYLRGLWKQKPQAWGPFSTVKSGVNRQGREIGLSIIDAIPFWKNAGSTLLNYGMDDRLGTIAGGMEWKAGGLISYTNSDYINFNSTTRKLNGFFFDYAPGAVVDAGGVICGLYFSDDARIYFRFTSSTLFKIFGVYDGKTLSQTITTPTMIAGNRYRVFWQLNSGYFELFIDGIYTGSASTSDVDVENLMTSSYYLDSRSSAVESNYYGKGKYYNHLTIANILSHDQVFELSDNPYQLWQPPVFRTYFIPSGTPTILNLADITQTQTIDKLDLFQQAILAINSIDQSQIIDNIILSLSQNLFIAGISQSQIIDNIGLIQQIALAINSLQQNQVLDTKNLIQQSLLSIQKLLQTQIIDNLTLLSATILTISELNQVQKVTNLDLLQRSNISIADNVQSQLLDNIVLLYGDVLAITGISQGQTSDNISLVQQNLLSVADINQMQTTDSVTLSVAGLLEIANLVQTQNLDVINLQQNFALAIDSLFQTQNTANIILDSSQILAIQKLVQNQLVDVISLVQQSVLNVDEISQQQILDNIEIVITKIAGKLSITFQLKTPGGRFTLR